MKKLIALIAALAISPLVAQVELEEVVLKAANYKYLNSVDNSEVPAAVRNLQEEVATFDTTDKDLYIDEDLTYNAAFEIPEGRILASYDANGNVLRTVERFKDVRLPRAIQKALTEQYSGWTVCKDLYLVNYSQELGARKVYDIKLTNDGKTKRVKLNDKGDYLEP